MGIEYTQVVSYENTEEENEVDDSSKKMLSQVNEIQEKDGDENGERGMSGLFGTLEGSEDGYGVKKNYKEEEISEFHDK